MGAYEPLPLDSPRWASLTHAYGAASDTPKLLGELLASPNRDVGDPTWDSLFGSICHQGSIYEASWAAFPHLAAIAERAEPRSALWAVNLMIAIAVSDDHRGKSPIDMMAPYQQALEKLPALGVRALAGAKSLHEHAICCGAILAGRGFLTAAAHVFDPLEGEHYACPNCDTRLG